MTGSFCDTVVAPSSLRSVSESCGSLMITVNSLTQKYIFMVTGNIRDLDPDFMDDLSMRRETCRAT